MPDYKAPLRDIRFVRDELLGYEAHYQSLPGCQDATPDMVDALERAIDDLVARRPLKPVFIVPGATRASAAIGASSAPAHATRATAVTPLPPTPGLYHSDVYPW